jgi:hypothetical protein
VTIKQTVDEVQIARSAGIYGIVGDSLNGLTDAVRRHGKIDWLHVRHEEVPATARVSTNWSATVLAMTILLHEIDRSQPGSLIVTISATSVTASFPRLCIPNRGRVL